MKAAVTEKPLSISSVPVNVTPDPRDACSAVTLFPTCTT
jgi:hypothetical protein